MSKVKQPLLSFDARRKLGDDIVFKRQGKTAIIETRPRPADARSAGQLSWRHMFQKVVALWHALSAAEKEAWESLGRKRHMTGYAWFISQALRPNPGIYLPLQGGTMSGDIDMVKNRILRLPLPVDGQEPVTLTYFNDNLPVGGYTEGARAYHSEYQDIPSGADTALALDSERWDTDTIHDLVINNSRLTCKTAGKYVIAGHIYWEGSAVGSRYLWIRLNGATSLAQIQLKGYAGTNRIKSIATIYSLAINDYIELAVHQNSGGILDISPAPNYSPEFAMQRIG